MTSLSNYAAKRSIVIFVRYCVKFVSSRAGSLGAACHSAHAHSRRRGGRVISCGAPNLPSLVNVSRSGAVIRLVFACVNERARAHGCLSRPTLAAATPAPLDSGRKAIRLRELSRGSAAQREELVSACGIPRREMEADETRSVSISVSTLPWSYIVARDIAVTAVHVRRFWVCYDKERITGHYRSPTISRGEENTVVAAVVVVIFTVVNVRVAI